MTSFYLRHPVLDFRSTSTLTAASTVLDTGRATIRLAALWGAARDIRIPP